MLGVGVCWETENYSEETGRSCGSSGGPAAGSVIMGHPRNTFWSKFWHCDDHDLQPQYVAGMIPSSKSRKRVSEEPVQWLCQSRERKLLLCSHSDVGPTLWDGTHEGFPKERPCYQWWEGLTWTINKQILTTQIYLLVFFVPEIHVTACVFTEFCFLVTKIVAMISVNLIPMVT